MRIIVFFCVIVFLTSCSASSRIVQNEQGYLIKKIKSINSWYAIYAEKEGVVFKIVVKKGGGNNIDCNKIKVGNYYILSLHARSENAPEIGGVKLVPMNRLDMQCYQYDSDTKICIEPKKGIFDLYYTNDLNGLCYVPKLE